MNIISNTLVHFCCVFRGWLVSVYHDLFPSSSSRSPVENTNTEQKCDAGAAEASCSASTKEAAEFKDNSCISKEESRRDSCDSDDQCADNSGEGTEQCADAEESKEKPKPVEDEPDAAYPEPRLPYPCTSSMSKKEQNMYLDILMRKNTRDPPQVPAFSPE